MPYTNRGRNSSRERGVASQGGETYIMLEILGRGATGGVKGEVGKPMAEVWTQKDKDMEELESEEDSWEEEEEEMEDQKKVDQWLIDDVLKELVEMELN